MELKDGFITKADPIDIDQLRQKIKSTALGLLDLPYDTDPTPEHCQYWRGKPYHKNDKGLWVLDFSKTMETADCSGLVIYVFGVCKLYLPNGANGQFEYCRDTKEPKVGDLAFAQTHGFKDHVGIYIGEGQILEARAHQDNCSFETGKVIIRPTSAWEKWNRFAGYRSHPLL